MIRTDGAGDTRHVLHFLHRRGVAYTIGWTLPVNTPQLYKPRARELVWQPGLQRRRAPPAWRGRRQVDPSGRCIPAGVGIAGIGALRWRRQNELLMAWNEQAPFHNCSLSRASSCSYLAAR